VLALTIGTPQAPALAAGPSPKLAPEAANLPASLTAIPTAVNPDSPAYSPGRPAQSTPGADVPLEAPNKWDEHHGLLGPVRLGPVIGTGFPNVVSFGVTAKLWGVLGLGFNYGMIPDMQISFYGQASIRYREFDVYARVYPFKGGFFAGLGGGYHRVEGTLQNTFNIPPGVQDLPPSYTVNSYGSVRSPILTPQIGYFRNFAFGLALGADLGAQIPIAASNVSFTSGLPTAVPPELTRLAEQQVTDTLHTVGRTPIPVVNLRAGWLF
jgi:hypothetical protein